MTIGVVTGLEAEARIARRWAVPVAVGGGTPAGAEAAALRLASQAPGPPVLRPQVLGLVSFGLAGGLDPALRPGDLLIPATILDAGQTWSTDPALNTMLGGCTGHVLRGGGTILATPAQKHAARQAGAHAVDLESAAVARVATRLGLPFAALRAICDDATRALPRAALIALDNTGRIGFLRIAAAILARPSDIPALIALGRDAARARTALIRRVADTHPRSTS